MTSLKSEKGKVLHLFIVDAFTKRPFGGNGAAVCLLPFNCELENHIKQKIAAEMKLSETAFVKITKDSDSFQSGKHFDLEWFTPLCQVPLCGHATLATAAVLFMECRNESEVLEFKTLSGILKAKKLPNNRIELDLPAYESIPVGGKFEKLVKAVVGNLAVLDVVLPVNKYLLIRLSDTVTREEFEGIKVTEAELLSASSDVTGVIVTLNASGKGYTDEEGNDYDFVSRFFSPWFGILEDPVTGSAHSVLAPYWANILQKKNLYARQCSTRGGELHLQLLEDRVLVSGHAAVVVKGQIHF